MISFGILLKVIFLLQFSLRKSIAFEAFAQADEGPYLGSFDTLIKDSYAFPLPNDLKATCKNGNQATGASIKTITTSMSSSQLQSFCGSDSICTVPAGLAVTMNSNLNVAALVIKGNLTWNENTQTESYQWLCAGYVAVCF